jgi:chloramphenicol O-acetyltransferase type A
MAEPLDLAAWSRRPHYEMFRGYDLPFWNLCAPVDATALRQRCHGPGGPSFFLASLFLSLKAANGVPELRLRLTAGGVLAHPVIHGGSTVLRPDGTFAFAYYDYRPVFADFEPAAVRAVEEAKASRGAPDPRDDRQDLIHYSVIPWVSFTSFQHARRLSATDSVPKIVFGKLYPDRDRWWLPVSVEVHHGLVDGLHVGRFFTALEELLGQVEEELGAPARPAGGRDV